MPDRYDVVVAGAGPAGSLFSLILARAGFSVLLLDRSYFPRQKVCGDCLNPRCWSIWKATGLEHSFRALPHHTVAGFTLSGEHSAPLTILSEKSNRDHRAVSRVILDDWLRREAMAAGAQCLTSVNLRSFEERRDLVTSEGTFQARLFIGADGRNSWMSRAAGLSTGRRRCTRIGWQTTLPASLADETVHMKFFEEGYFGLVRYSETEANLCMLLDGNSYNTPQMIIDRFFDDLPPLGWKSTFPISRTPNTAGEGNVLLLGDAARLMEPFTGEGIYMALLTAWSAAHLCIGHLADQRPPSELGRIWRSRQRRLYTRHITFHNNLTRWLAVKPERGLFAVNLLNRAPGLLRILTRSHLPKISEDE